MSTSAFDAPTGLGEEGVASLRVRQVDRGPGQPAPRLLVGEQLCLFREQVRQSASTQRKSGGRANRYDLRPFRSLAVVPDGW